MSREEKINKMIEDIEIRRNDEQYRGGPFPIYHIEFDILKEEIERLNNKVEELMTLYTTEREVKEDYKSIIKEVREYIEKHIAMFKNGNMLVDINVDELLEILDKGSDKND